MQGKYDEAEPLFERVVVLFEESLGRDHDDVVTALSSHAEVLTAQV